MSFDIGEYHTRATHLYADLIETLLMVGYEEKKSIYIRNSDTLLSGGDLSPEELDYFSELQEIDDEATKQEVLSELNEDCLNTLEFRLSTYGEDYPFYIKGGALFLKDDLTPSHFIYFLLLACSRLRSFELTIRQKWSGYFTEASKIALESIMPKSGDVKIFDANTDDRRNCFHTDYRKALKELGKMIGASATIEKACDEESSSGDGGLDLVGIFNYNNDAAPGYFVVFGQCAAQEKNWPSKVFEAHPLSFSNFFALHIEPLNTVFIPICFRKADGTWVQGSKVNGCVMHDRKRIMMLLKDHHSKSLTEITSSEWLSDFKNDLSRIIDSQRIN